jgi:curli biogenesis system outer membrane secretion channel CsgG
MKNLIHLLALGSLGFLAACAPTVSSVSSSGNVGEVVAYDGPKARLVVGNLNCRAGGCGSVGGSMADSLTAALFRSNRFVLLERDNIEAIQSESALLQSNVVQEGADLVISGAITAFEPNASGNAGGISLPVFGGIRLGNNEAYIAMDLRLIDVRTRRIVNVTSVEGRSSSFSASGYGGGFIGGRYLGGSLSTYSNGPMGQAIAVLLESAVREMSKLVPQEYYRVPNNASAAQAAAPKPVQPAAVPAAPKTTAPAAIPPMAQGNLARPKILPGNALPFSDDFEGRDLGAKLAETNPEQYGRANCPGRPTEVGIGSVGNVLDKNQNSTKALELGEISSCTGDSLAQINALTIGSTNWNNYRMSFDFFVAGRNGSNDDGLGIRLNFQPDGSSYDAIWFNSNYGTVAAQKVLGSQQTVLASRNLGRELSDVRWCGVVIENRSGSVKVSLNNTLILEFKDSDPRYAQGGVGFMRGNNNYGFGIFVDNLKIEALR